MKRFLLTCAIVAICIGSAPIARANPTLSATTDSTSTTTKKDSDEDSFFEECLYWLLDDVFGWDRDKDKRRYYPKSTSQNDGSGDNGSDYDFGDGGWYPGDGWDSGDGGWGSGSGDGGWDSGSGDGGSGSGDGGWDSGSGDGSSGSGNGGWDSGSGDGGWTPGGSGWGWGNGDGGNPTPTIPVPGALVLGGIGSALVSWLRRRKSL